MAAQFSSVVRVGQTWTNMHYHAVMTELATKTQNNQAQINTHRV